MMPSATIVLRLQAPIQSWGDAASRWDYRTTGSRPTKSGVIGLLAASMGRGYTDSIDDLAALKFATRADRPGHIELDLRTAGAGTFPLDALTRWHNPKLEPDPVGRINYGAPRASENNSWNKKARSAVFRTATYIADAAFLVGLTGNSNTIAAIEDALQQPATLIYLGRRAHPPSHELHHITLHGDHHNTWLDTVELIDVATDNTPHAWLEPPPEPHRDRYISYEQPSTATRSQQGAPQLPLHILTRRATPPRA